MSKSQTKTYVAIDLKSFFASVECVERGRDPLTTNLVVADSSRTEKTICLAVSPSLKRYGLGGRARLFEVVQTVKKANDLRRTAIKGKPFTCKSDDAGVIDSNEFAEIDYVVATPHMAKYIEYSTKIYDIYLRYVAPEDVHVYSIDEVFIDATDYLKIYKMNARQFVMKLICDVLAETGITATAGIGTNLYLCKIAMDIVAKRIAPDENGVRIAELDEMSYRKQLWNHTPLTDFWRIGAGYSRRLAEYGMFTMGDVARCSVDNEELLYKVFGVNAELLIDHAWGWEPCTIDQIKAYRPEHNSISTGQVLTCPYDFAKARLIVREMVELLSLDLVDKQLFTNQIVLNVGYDVESLRNEKIANDYHGEVVCDHYGRPVPKPAHGSENLDRFTSSTKMIAKATMKLFDRIVDGSLLVRRVSITANNVIYENTLKDSDTMRQMDMFVGFDEVEKQNEEIAKEKRLQKTTIAINKKFGKNALLKGMNYQEGATTKQRNKQIGGHKA